MHSKNIHSSYIILRQKLPNRRVEYTYLCEVEDGDYSAKGLDGEFDNKTSRKWCTANELEEMGLWSQTMELIKKVERTSRDRN